jgi:uncharacterized protein (TIGR04255 family)
MVEREDVEFLAMSRRHVQPFGSDPVDELPLSRPPLAKVIAQIRFPEIASIANPAFVGPLQEELRAAYPNAATETAIEPTADAPSRTVQLPYVSTWKFTDVPGNWIVALAHDFVAIETTAYASREDFISRWGTVIDAVVRTIRPNIYGRLGVRYVNRIDRTEDIAAIGELCNEALLPLGELVRKSDGVRQKQSFLQSEFEVGGATMRLRSAVLPPKFIIDPGTLAPVDRTSWVLDIDMFSEHAPPIPIVAEEVVERSRSFAESVYRLFRWSVTDEFLRRMGGKA